MQIRRDEAISSQLAALDERLQACEKDNRTIYHARIPGFDDLSLADKVVHNSLVPVSFLLIGWSIGSVSDVETIMPSHIHLYINIYIYIYVNVTM